MNELRFQIFTALDNAKKNGYDETNWEPESLVEDLQKYCQPLESANPTEMLPIVIEWQHKL